MKLPLSDKRKSILNLFLYSALLCCAGCISTSYQGPRKSPVHLSATDKILIPYFPEVVEKEDRRPLSKIFEKYGLQAHYGDLERLSLTSTEINNAPDAGYVKTLTDQGYQYVLIITDGEKITGESFYHKSAAEVSTQGSSSTPDQVKNKANATVQLFSLREMTTLYTISAETTISPFQWQGKNGGENYINFSSADGALWIAIKKGTKKMLKRCSK